MDNRTYESDFFDNLDNDDYESNHYDGPLTALPLGSFE